MHSSSSQRIIMLLRNAFFTLVLAVWLAPARSQAAPVGRSDAEYLSDFTSRDPHARRDAALYLAVKKRSLDGLIPNYLALLDDSDASVREAAAAALAKTKSSEAFEPLMKVVEAGSLGYNTGVVVLLAYVDRSVPRALEMIDRPERNIRYTLVRFLPETKDPRVIEPLVAKMRTDKEFRLLAGRALPRMGLVIVPKLIELLSDADEEMAHTAFSALERMNDASAEEASELYRNGQRQRALEELRSEDGPTRRHGIARVQRLGKGADELVPEIGKLLEAKRFAEEELDALGWALESIGTERARSVMPPRPIRDSYPNRRTLSSDTR